MSAPTKLIFSSSIEALLKAGRGRIGTQTVQQLGRLGLPVEGRLEPAYPAETWASAVQLIGVDLFPADPPDTQHNKLARLTVRQFAETVMGRAMFTAARVFGARRSLQRMTHNLRTGANFIETRFTELSPTLQELWINDVSGVPGFYAGLIEVGHEYMPGWVSQVRIKDRDGAACTYQLITAT